MKRIISIVLCAIILALPLASCGRPSGDPDETSQRDAYLENRKKFLESDLYRDAVDYLTTVFSELLPDAVTDFSLEPGSIDAAELERYSGFAGDTELRKELFSLLDLSVRTNYWEFPEEDPMEIGSRLIDKGITVRLMAGPAGADYFDVDAKAGTCTLVNVPEAN